MRPALLPLTLVAAGCGGQCEEVHFDQVAVVAQSEGATCEALCRSADIEVRYGWVDVDAVTACEVLGPVDEDSGGGVQVSCVGTGTVCGK